MPGSLGARLKLRPILVLNPRSDRSFVTYVERLSREELSSPADLQARLQEQFPRAVVHERAISGEDVAMWYVYRDGHWTRDQAGSDQPQEGNGVGAGGRSSGDD
jgi:hypothetical protein